MGAMEVTYDLDKVSGNLFCRSCGNNYLLGKHKENCEYVKAHKEKEQSERVSGMEQSWIDYAVERRIKNDKSNL